MSSTTNIVDITETISRNMDIVENLEMAIRCRYYIMKVLYNGGDEQHAHFRDLLIECWEKLHDMIDLQVDTIRKAQGTPIRRAYCGSVRTILPDCAFVVLSGGLDVQEEESDIISLLDIFDTDIGTHLRKIQYYVKYPCRSPCDMSLDELINGDDYYYDIMIAPYI